MKTPNTTIRKTDTEKMSIEYTTTSKEFPKKAQTEYMQIASMALDTVGSCILTFGTWQISEKQRQALLVKVKDIQKEIEVLEAIENG